MRYLWIDNGVFMMKFEGGKVKPCSSCYKARQAAKDAAAAMLNRRVRYTLVETENGDLTVDDKHTIIEATNQDHVGLIGRRVYLAGKRVIDVEKASAAANVGRIIKVSPITL